MPTNPFDLQNFHVAVWYEDLAELHNRDFISGITCVTEREWQIRKWEHLRSLAPAGSEFGYEDPNGRFVPLDEPSFQEFDDDANWRSFVVSDEGRISVTDKGCRFMLNELQAENVDFSTTISPKVARLFGLGFFDTCIREACVQLEHEIKVRIGSADYGEKLTQSFISTLRAKSGLLESYVRTFRQELRTVFKFIRNDYMHNLLEADEVTAYSILFRIGRIRSVLATEHD
uniref:Uncharacterized protein n=1 Tax=Solibacter usitatus (strain Ellin6076) TaxID=234267 RepID=Q01TP9_SOLUE